MRMQLWAIIKKAKEGKQGGGGGPEAPLYTDFYCRCRRRSWEWPGKSLSGSWGDDQTISPSFNKDLKLSRKLERWWRQLKAMELKKEQI